MIIRRDISVPCGMTGIKIMGQEGEGVRAAGPPFRVPARR